VSRKGGLGALLELAAESKTLLYFGVVQVAAQQSLSSVASYHGESITLKPSPPPSSAVPPPYQP
jgi:hypothetical protein